MPWTVRVGRGWRQLEKPPQDVEMVAEIHKEGKDAVISQHCDSHLKGFRGLGDCALYGDGHSFEPRTAAQVLTILHQFLTNLHLTDTDVTSLIFVNFKPREFTLSPRPQGGFADVASVTQGLLIFFENVAGSLEPFGNHDAMWSLCDWAMLTCTRTP